MVSMNHSSKEEKKKVGRATSKEKNRAAKGGPPTKEGRKKGRAALASLSRFGAAPGCVRQCQSLLAWANQRQMGPASRWDKTHTQTRGKSPPPPFPVDCQRV